MYFNTVVLLPCSSSSCVLFITIIAIIYYVYRLLFPKVQWSTVHLICRQWFWDRIIDKITFQTAVSIIFSQVTLYLSSNAVGMKHNTEYKLVAWLIFKAFMNPFAFMSNFSLYQHSMIIFEHLFLHEHFCHRQTFVLMNN